MTKDKNGTFITKKITNRQIYEKINKIDARVENIELQLNGHMADIETKHKWFIRWIGGLTLAFGTAFLFLLKFFRT